MAGVDNISKEMKRTVSFIHDQSQILASGGTTGKYSSKTPTQVGVRLSEENTMERIQGYKASNSSVESILRFQQNALSSINDQMQELRERFIPGRNVGYVIGLEGIKENTVNNLHSALTTKENNSGVYVFGGAGELVNPILDIRDNSIFAGISAGSPWSASDFSLAVNSSVSVFVNDSGDTFNKPLVTASHQAIVKSVEAVMLLRSSITGLDDNAQAAVTAADDAQKLLKDAMFEILQSLEILKNSSNDNTDREILSQELINNTFDDQQDALIKLKQGETRLETLGHLNIVDIKLSKQAAELLKNGS